MTSVIPISNPTNICSITHESYGFKPAALTLPNGSVIHARHIQNVGLYFVVSQFFSNQVLDKNGNTILEMPAINGSNLIVDHSQGIIIFTNLSPAEYGTIVIFNTHMGAVTFIQNVPRNGEVTAVNCENSTCTYTIAAENVWPKPDFRGTFSNK